MKVGLKFLLVAVGCLLVIGLLLGPWLKPINKPPQKFMGQLFAKHIPVYLFRQGSWCGNGTLCYDQAGAAWIIASAHQFNHQVGQSVYHYQILRPFSPALHPIESVKCGGVRDDASGALLDVAIGKGGQSRAIDACSNFPTGAWVREGNPLLVTRLDSGPELVSLVSGGKVQLIGVINEPQEAPRAVLLYESSPGESGTGFVDEEGRLYVLTSGLKVEAPLRQILEIPISFRWVSLAVALQVEIGDK